MKVYFQTTEMKPEDLADAVQKAGTQNGEILNFMKWVGVGVTCWQIKDRFKDYEITSIRRGLNTLLKEGKVSHIRDTMERKGRPCGVYQAV